jgi:hypothetical protein
LENSESVPGPSPRAEAYATEFQRLKRAMDLGSDPTKEAKPHMPDTLCANPSSNPAAPEKCCAMIFRSPVARANWFIFSRGARRCTLMTPSQRIKHFCRALAFLCACVAVPCQAPCATLEESAKDFAQKIVATLPAKENVTYEIRNLSTSQPGEVSRIGQAFLVAMKESGIMPASTGGPATIVITLSENFRNLVWTAEIRQGDPASVVLLEVQRSVDTRITATSMPVSIHSEKFWEGPDRILDAGEISDGSGKSWLVLLMRGGLRILDKQSGAETMTEIISNQSASRDPWGNLSFIKNGGEFGFFLAPRFCSINLATRILSGCSAGDDSSASSSASHVPVMIDVAPSGAPLPGKGTEIVIGAPVCGGASQFLATGARDYTQPDSLQLFEMKPGGAAAISAELNFPGPITALHASSESPRAVVKNLSTGNYEAYRLSLSCAQ